MKKILSSILIFAMLFTLAPTAFAADKYAVQFDKTNYEVEVGGELTVPIYVSKADGTDAVFTVVQVNVPIPEGFTATVSKGVAATVSIVGSRAKFFKGVDTVEEAFTCGKSAPFGTMTLTAPNTPGTYTLEFYKPELFDLENEDGCDAANITKVSATITVKAAETKTLTGITVKPEKIDNIPYDLKDDETGKAAYVKGKIESVIANYSNGDTEAVTEYDVTTSGEVATVTYKDQKATIALSFTTPVASGKYAVQFGNTEYEVEAGGELTVPIYVSKADGTDAIFTVVQVNVPIPEGFTATVSKGVAATVSIVGSRAKFFKGVDTVEEAFTCGKSAPFGTMTLTAPNTPGTYTLEFYKPELFDLENEDGCDAANITKVSATITVKAAETKTLTGITVKPEKIDNIPYDLKDDETGKAAYVKGKIESVIANYSNGDTEAVTEYDVTTSGEVATVTYKDQKATIALSFTTPVASGKYAVQFGNTEYEVEAGGELTVPIYVSKADGTDAIFTVVQVNVPIPEGFTATVSKGVAATVSIVGSRAKFFKGVDTVEEAFTCGKSAPFGTMTLTAPNTPGTYTLEFYKPELFDLENEDGCDAADITTITATITVTGGSTPAKVLDSIEISSAADPIVIPYGADAEETIRKAITVKAIYSNAETEDNVTGYDVAIDENVATISYTVDGTTKTAAINIKYQPTPVLTVEKSEITVPYGTEDVEAYVKAEIKSGKVKLDETDLTFDDYVIEFTNGADTATVKYAKDEAITATVSVKYVELDKINVVIKGDGTEVKIPWDSTDDATAVKALITVTAVFTNGAHDNEITNYTVDFGEGTFTVSYGGLTSEPIPYSKDAKPEAKVTGIKAEPTELNVPYANTVSNDEIIKFVKANVKVTATYDDESTSDVAEYGVTIADDKATITYEGFTADVTLVKETRKLELSNTEITVDEGTDKDGIIAYVKANVTAKYVYSQTTAEQTIPVDELAITVNDELTEVTVEVGGESAKIAVNIKVVPNFVETVKADTNAYGIATAKLVIFTDVKDGKVVKVTDEKGTYDAIYMGNGKWAAVVTGSYTAFADNGSLPEAAKFGRLHDASMITAYDALLTLLKANNGAVNVFDNDYQKYLLADVNGDGTLTADEALYINRISLGNADESTLWFNK